MRGFSYQIIPVLLLVVAGACSHNPTYGRPMPRDTVTTAKEPVNPEPDAKNPRQPPESRRRTLPTWVVGRADR